MILKFFSCKIFKITDLFYLSSFLTYNENNKINDFIEIFFNR
jgi:hypothetical protein